MLNKAQRARVDKACSSAIDCTVRVKHGERTFITGDIVEASFLRWDEDSISTKGKLALFKIRINVTGAIRTPEEGPLYRTFTVLRLPYGPGKHEIEDYDYAKSVVVKF